MALLRVFLKVATFAQFDYLLHDLLSVCKVYHMFHFLNLYLAYTLNIDFADWFQRKAIAAILPLYYMHVGSEHHTE